MKKRILAFILCLSMICGMIPVSTYAVSDEEGQSVVCEECSETEGHLKTCSKYEPVCTCTPVDGVHQEGCDFYVEPQTQKCEYCGVELTEGAEHAQNCQTRCTCTPVNAVHQRNCVFAPKEENTGIKVGDTIWIKNGSLTYKDTNTDSMSRDVLLNYETKVVSVIEKEDGSVWYEFEPTSLLAIFKDYKYVQAENTCNENPDKTDALGIPVCDCGYSENGGLDAHTDTCARKQYVRYTYIVQKSAEEIYDDWDKFDNTIKDAILLFLSWDDQEKLAALTELLEKGEFSDKSLHYTTTAEGMSVDVFAGKDTFPEGTALRMTSANVDETAAVNAIQTIQIQNMDLTALINAIQTIQIQNMDLTALKIVGMDISFLLDGKEQQPQDSVILRVTLPYNSAPEDANMIALIHMGSNGAEVVGYSYLQQGVSEHVILAKVDGFSHYAAVYVNGNYKAALMRDQLLGDSRYSISEFPVTLFDYNGAEFDAAASKLNNGENFYFRGVNGTIDNSGTGGINNSDQYAKQGILNDTLNADGFPVINYSGVTGEDLFSTTKTFPGKTIYANKNMEFIYDNETGYYTYKSSANHAEYNSTTDKIELYADTLGPANNKTASLDLTQFGNEQSRNHIESVGVNNGVMTLKTSANSGRCDPYIPLAVNFKAEDVNQIYIKVRIPGGIGKNKFQIFFNAGNGFNENDSFVVDYTANGDWLDIVIDASVANTKSGNGNWNGNITQLRIDPFDGTNCPSYTIEIAEISLIKNVDELWTRGGFYPFSAIAKSYPGNGGQFSMETWKNVFNDSTLKNQLSTRSMTNNKSQSSVPDSELHFAMVSEFDFYMPVSGKVNDEDIKFEFTGDDDLWVFVDGKLALDIGGGHGAIYGYIDFTNQKSYVEKATSVTGYNNCSGTIASVETTLDKAIAAPGRHTIKIFYMERCASVSNCFIKFNLPQTPEGSVMVSKTLKLENEDSNSEDTAIRTTESFDYTIKRKNTLAGANGSQSFYTGEYTLYDYLGNSSKMTTNNGTFALKNGEYAIFEISEGYEVTITEKADHSIMGYDFVSTTVNKKTSNFDTLTTAENEQIAFEFVNTYREKSVKYTYIPVNPKDCPDDIKGTVELTGQGNRTYSENGVFETVGVRIDDPCGSTAKDNDAVKFVGWFTDLECTQPVTNDTYAKVDKKVIDPVQTDGVYTGGTFYSKFEYMYGDLQIQKSGIQDIDNNEVDEQQSTIYNVNGTSYSGERIDIDVVIVGNQSALVKNLPVGQYIVTEKSKWSWRYETEESLKNVTVEDGKTAKAEFKNNRKQPYWLSGDCYTENLWGQTDKNTIYKDPTKKNN